MDHDRATTARLRQRATTARTIRQLRARLRAAQRENAALRDECAAYGVEIDRLRIETFTDPLTGAYNRVGLRQIWAEISDTVTAVCLLDCDWFKQINDRYGHPTGDVVICHIVESTRGQGVNIARTGGDEFSLLVTDDQGDPETVIRRVLVAIARPRMIKGNMITVTATVGICLVDQTTNGPALSLVDYLDQADAALYQGKHAGRNTVVVTKL